MTERNKFEVCAQKKLPTKGHNVVKKLLTRVFRPVTSFIDKEFNDITCGFEETFKKFGSNIDILDYNKLKWIWKY